MTTFQFFSLIEGLQIGALTENFVLQNAYNGGTVHTAFDIHAQVDKDVVPGSYIWIWADDNSDVQFIEELINETLQIQDSLIATWIEWSLNAEPRAHYILLVEKLV